MKWRMESPQRFKAQPSAKKRAPRAAIAEAMNTHRFTCTTPDRIVTTLIGGRCAMPEVMRRRRTESPQAAFSCSKAASLS